MARLMITDPLKHTREDRDLIIRNLRAARAQFSAGVKPPPKISAATTKTKAIAGSIKLAIEL